MVTEVTIPTPKQAIAAYHNKISPQTDSLKAKVSDFLMSGRREWTMELTCEEYLIINLIRKDIEAAGWTMKIWDDSQRNEGYYVSFAPTEPIFVQP